ncbi:hypothetical protein D3C87_22010 [compost metagenome]
MLRIGIIPFIMFCFLISGCKKEKGVLDDFPPGRFNFVYILNNNSNQDTVIGELSGPHVESLNYFFMVRQELLMDKQLKGFNVGTFKSIINGHFAAQVNTSSTIIYEDHTSDYLLVRFDSGNNLYGSLTLTRKE